MTTSTNLSADQLLSQWLVDYSANLPLGTSILRVIRAEPRLQTRNYFARYKISTATLDGSGMNPTDIRCVVLEISETDQRAALDPSTACNAIRDL